MTALYPGSRVGPYEISAKLGEGGMGQVWRARDERVGREVALKVLPPGLTADADRTARFEREARLLGQLNHPNIAQLYGFEVHGETRALVLELVEGPTLAERLAGGALPLDEALAVARQLTEALEAAHEKGIVHRDLKPQNVKLSPEGAVKVLDFGLAKALDVSTPASGAPSAMASPTLTSGEPGLSLPIGTAAYMPPEQAKGAPLDRRADIWAFGVVLYEMLSGRRLFAAPSTAETLALVLGSPVDWSVLPADTPPALRRLLRRCLERNPRNRLHDVADARLVLDDLARGESDPTAPPAAESRGGRFWPVATVLAAAASAWISALVWRSPATGPSREVRFTVAAPRGTTFDAASSAGGVVAVSPEARRIAFTARDGAGNVRLYVRPLAAEEATAVPGTEGAEMPFWSPDAHRLGFFAAGRLKTVPLTGGAPRSLAEAPDARGGSWSPRGVILYAPDSRGPLFAIDEEGGAPRAVGELDAARGENSHRYPEFLPGGDRFLYLSRSHAGSDDELTVMAGDLRGGAAMPLLHATTAASVGGDRLVFLRGGILFAQAFDARRLALTGEPEVIASGVREISSGRGVYSLAGRELLVYLRDGGPRADVLRWRARDGRLLETLGGPGDLSYVALSPRGDLAIVRARDAESGNRDLWVVDLARGARTRFTFAPESDHFPVFSADGARVAWSTERNGVFTIWRKAIAGVGEAERVEEYDRPTAVAGWHPATGELLLVQRAPDGRADSDLVALPPGGAPRPFVTSPGDERSASFSPDGRWVVYSSNESGRYETYVAPFPGPGRRWQVSSEGGGWCLWRADGREILYSSPAGVAAVAVSAEGDGLAFGPPRPLFAPGSDLVAGGYGLDPAGERLLVVESLRPAAAESLTAIVGWRGEAAAGDD